MHPIFVEPVSVPEVLERGVPVFRMRKSSPRAWGIA
jgi:hypothetical protein